MGFRSHLVAWLMGLFALTACTGSGPAKKELALDDYGTVLGLHITATGIITFDVAEDVMPPALLGTAERNEILNPTAYYEVPNTLTIRWNDTEYFYDLHDVLFRLEYESPAYEVVGLVRYGKDLIVEIASGARNTEAVALIPVRERITLGDTTVMLDYLELDRQAIRIFFDAAREVAHIYPYSDLDPADSCILQIDPGPLGLGVDESTRLAPDAIITQEEQPGTHYRGYAEFPRSLLREGYDYEFRYECYEQYRFELPFQFE